MSLFKGSGQGLVTIVGRCVKGWGKHHMYKSPHKDGSRRMCVCEREGGAQGRS